MSHLEKSGPDCCRCFGLQFAVLARTSEKFEVAAITSNTIVWVSITQRSRPTVHLLITRGIFSIFRRNPDKYGNHHQTPDCDDAACNGADSVTVRPLFMTMRMRSQEFFAPSLCMMRPR